MQDLKAKYENHLKNADSSHSEVVKLRQKIKNMQEQIKELDEDKSKRDEGKARLESQLKVQHQAQLKDARLKLKSKHD